MNRREQRSLKSITEFTQFAVRAEMRALDAKLDAFAAMLKERRPVAGQG